MELKIERHVEYAPPRAKPIEAVLAAATRRDHNILKRSSVLVVPTISPPAVARPYSVKRIEEIATLAERLATAGGPAPYAYVGTLGPDEPSHDAYDFIASQGPRGIILDNASQSDDPAWHERMRRIARRLREQWDCMVGTEATRRQPWVTPPIFMHAYGKTLIDRAGDDRFWQPGQWPMLVDCWPRVDRTTGLPDWNVDEARDYSLRLARMGVPVVLPWHADAAWCYALDEAYARLEWTEPPTTPTPTTPTTSPAAAADAPPEVSP